MMIPARIILLILLFSFFKGSFAQTVVINEVMSSNKTTITDEDGDTPDWIELFNTGNDTMNLNGYGLSDDPADPFKWIFPDLTMSPQNFLLVFASGKDRTEAGIHWETIINWGDEWKYFVPQEELPVNWRLPFFDDSSWPIGPSGFGYGDDDDATIVSQTMSVFIRKSFSMESMPEILKAFLHTDYDDAFVAYLNGQEIARANIGTPGTYPAWNEPALQVTEPLMVQGLPPAAFAVDPELLLPGTNVLAIEVHNFDITSSDLTLIPFFSVLPAEPLPNPSGSSPLLHLQDPRLHTNFKISSAGETVLLTSADFYTDSVQTGELRTDISKGRQPDGSSTWFYFTGATPEMPNNVEGWPGISETVHFSIPAGFYPGIVSVALNTVDPDDIIYYTLDGSDPNTASAVYSNPIFITHTTVIRALAVHIGYLPARIATSTYFIGEEHDLPVISLSTTPDNLFDPVIGIYHENNIWNDWERPMHVEFFDTGDTSGFSIDAGAKIYGGWTRTLPQKSFSIFAREAYGYDEIKYPLFTDLPYDKYESFILRNSGNDWQNTMFRDGLMTGLVAQDGLDIPAFRPSAVYINGDYWGIYNIREKQNDRYLEQHHGVSHDSIDLLEFAGQPIAGDPAHYNSMIYFIENNPLSDPANYAYIKTQMDIENFITYEITQIFINNTDWPGNNIKYWRPKTPGGKWKWLLYDTDFGFGLVYDYTYNTLAFAAEPNGPDWPNPPWSTFLLRSLLTNDEFRIDFINRYADLLNSSFRTQRMLQQIDQKKSWIINEMPNQLARWGGTMWDWLLNIQVLRTFAMNRRAYAQNHVVNFFNLPEYSNVELNVEPASSGMIKISTLAIEEFPWTGEYFNGVPVKLKAIPLPGFKFSGWQGDVVSDSASITVTFTGPTELTATFEAYIPDTIVINEINYHSAPDFNPEDWVEFYNPDDSLVDLTGWVFKDEDDAHSFPFPSGTVIEPYGYLVLCFDTTAFDSLFPDVTNNIGNMGFGLSGNGELIRLYDPSGLLIDTVHYNDSIPWPIEPDGNGPTLELIDPSLDNALPESWMASGQHGTPGKVNGVYVWIDHDQAMNKSDFRISPNPFNTQTEFLINSLEDQMINIEIFNSCGVRISDISPMMLHKGMNSISWDGKAASGEFIKAGLYFCKISGRKMNISRKIIRIK